MGKEKRVRCAHLPGCVYAHGEGSRLIPEDRWLICRVNERLSTRCSTYVEKRGDGETEVSGEKVHWAEELQVLFQIEGA